MKAAIKTLGCKVNSYESEAVSLLLKERGYEIVSFDEFADVYIINTCMVTNTAEAKSRQTVHRPLKKNPDAIIVVMGCLTQLKAEEILKIPGVKIVLGTSRRDEIPDFIEEYQKNKVLLNKTHLLERKEPYDHLAVKDFLTHQRAFLKIQDGCNNYCSYCIIPFTRGPVRSKPIDHVLSEAKTLVEKGHLEIILTGIHTGGYGQDLEKGSFARLLRALENIEGLKRIRISSIEITELTEDVISVIQQSTKIVNHLHVPIQGATDEILKRMNRKYTLSEYINKIEELKKAIPDLAVTTDYIVGFPGETEEQHQEALRVIAKMGYFELHVFPYSKRSGTVSAKMKNEVLPDVKKRWVHDFLDLSDQLAKTYIKERIGKIYEVLPETFQDGYLTGHTANYMKVKFLGQMEQIGHLVPVLLVEEKYPLILGKQV